MNGLTNIGRKLQMKVIVTIEDLEYEYEPYFINIENYKSYVKINLYWIDKDGLMQEEILLGNGDKLELLPE